MLDHPHPQILLSDSRSEPTITFHGVDCDCSCSEDSFSLALTQPPSDLLLRQAQLHMQPLSSEHTLVFNPHNNQGVAVLNQAAKQVWEHFHSPHRPDTLDTTLTPVVAELVQAGLLEPVGSQLEVQRGDPRTLSAWLHVTNECNLRCDYCYVS